MLAVPGYALPHPARPCAVPSGQVVLDDVNGLVVFGKHSGHDYTIGHNGLRATVRGGTYHQCNMSNGENRRTAAESVC